MIPKPPMIGFLEKSLKSLMFNMHFIAFVFGRISVVIFRGFVELILELDGDDLIKVDDGLIRRPLESVFLYGSGLVIIGDAFMKINEFILFSMDSQYYYLKYFVYKNEYFIILYNKMCIFNASSIFKLFFKLLIANFNVLFIRSTSFLCISFFP